MEISAECVYAWSKLGRLSVVGKNAVLRYIIEVGKDEIAEYNYNFIFFFIKSHQYINLVVNARVAQKYAGWPQSQFTD